MTGSSFLCPDCDGATLVSGPGIELPPDSRSDEISLQALCCTSCSFRGIAIYRESRRGALDSESWEHLGYRVPQSVLVSVQDAIALCPEPGRRSCRCTAHVLLGAQDSQGAWTWPLQQGIDAAHSFTIHRS